MLVVNRLISVARVKSKIMKNRVGIYKNLLLVNNQIYNLDYVTRIELEADVCADEGTPEERHWTEVCLYFAVPIETQLNLEGIEAQGIVKDNPSAWYVSFTDEDLSNKIRQVFLPLFSKKKLSCLILERSPTTRVVRSLFCT